MPRCAVKPFCLSYVSNRLLGRFDGCEHSTSRSLHQVSREGVYYCDGKCRTTQIIYLVLLLVVPLRKMSGPV